MVDVALADDGDRLEAAVRMLREARDDIAVIHPPAVLAFEVLPDIAAAERRLRTELVIAGRIEINVMDAEQKRVVRLPALAERVDPDDWIHGIRLLGRACLTEGPLDPHATSGPMLSP